MRDQECNRAIMVGHNAHFDAGFLNAAVERCDIKRNPFHPFSHFDTATLPALAYGQTVLAKSCAEAGIAFDNSEAHSAAYDAERTARAVLRHRQSLAGAGRLARRRARRVEAPRFAGISRDASPLIRARCPARA
jgi:ribonuclease T